MTIDQLFVLAQSSESFFVPDSWAQGRTLYGGLTAAMLLVAIEKEVDNAKLLRTLNISFSAPASPNIELSIETELLREGKNVAQWQARLMQQGVCCVQVNAAFGMALATNVSVESCEIPDMASIDESFLYPEGAGPRFTEYFEAYQATKDFPLLGTDGVQLGGWIKFKQAPEVMTSAHLIALLDAWPPAISIRLTEFKAGSTVSWSIQFPNPLVEMKASEHLGFLDELDHAADGFSYSRAKIWNNQGQLLALSYQTVITF